MTLKKIALLFALASIGFSLDAQKIAEFKPECDSLQVLLQERIQVRGIVRTKKILKRGNELDFYFTSDLAELPWRSEDVIWFRNKLKELLPEAYSSQSIGRVFIGSNKTFDDYVLPSYGNDGKPVTTMFRSKDARTEHPFIEEKGAMSFDKGLSGRNITLWQSHGRYYEEKTHRWEWQRAPVFQTVEDMYTQSYVLPFLIPMLENSGAYVMTPRERDPQRNEIVADNDESFTDGRGKDVRIAGEYSEVGDWSSAGTGFADTKAFYLLGENPFSMGTARMAQCHEHKHDEKSEAIWTPNIPERGFYSVYISYKSLLNSSECAHYTVKHMSGSTEFFVNQRLGGGTWIYLGTFEFDKGNLGCVILDNCDPEGRRNSKDAVVTADAVRFGGGMGKIARKDADAPLSDARTSGMPSFSEGAYYWMQWAGTDSTVMNLQDNDYTSDYADRGAWTKWMAGGSRVNPDEPGLKIPLDLNFAFHTDAGTTPNDSIVGTLAIYTLMADGKDKFANGEDRQQQRLYTDFVQSQIVDDIRKCYYGKWSRRGIWDKSYSESRTTAAPAMLLELLSHQNFEDMKYGLDPSFRFTVSRAIYKGMLKFLSSKYGIEYSVQPLPVNSFATAFNDNMSSVTLSWKATVDTLEQTAMPTGYILYTRIDNGGFDQGRLIAKPSPSYDRVMTDVEIAAGHIYSFKVVAYNDGGKSFPSEILSVGFPNRVSGASVGVVNNYTRVSGPAWFDSPEYAGFDNRLDSGSGYINEINFIGEQYQIRRDLPWLDDDNPGFGASYTDKAGMVIPGNTFDFTITHGKALMENGHPFHSVSRDAFTAEPSLCNGDFAIDLLCGKQVTTPTGSQKSKCKYDVFPEALQKAITDYTAKGGNVLVSGAHIGTDVWDQVYPVAKDSLLNVATKDFVQKTLGFKWMTNYATRLGNVSTPNGSESLSFNMSNNGKVYNVETPDGIVPASDKAKAMFLYTDTRITAGTGFDAKTYRTVCLGFPIETINGEEKINSLMAKVMEYFERK